jgi:hypothetical protein
MIVFNRLTYHNDPKNKHKLFKEFIHFYLVFSIKYLIFLYKNWAESVTV